MGPQTRILHLSAEVGSEQGPSRRAKRRFRRYGVPIATLVFFVGLLVGAGAIANHCPMISIADSSFSIEPSSYVQFPLTETNAGDHGLYGSFSSSSPVSLYVMSTSQFASFASTRVANSTILSVGPVTSYQFPETCTKACFSTVFVQQGTYYIVFNNANTSVGASINITWQLHAETC